MSARLDRRVTFERQGAGRNALNEPTGAWAPLATLWAARTDLSETERGAAGQIGAVRAARFTLRRSVLTRSLTGADRLRDEGMIWNITGVAARGLWIDVSAVSNGRKEEA
ncbi:phage head closure protein [Rhodovulum sulfidophilum]|uniref:Phage head closure protein n=1 Tax=Rhodovulum sulfidophilum TaxID=35806 RepID=A0ABS1RYH5_RHOSU|nr:phage head closure protein [Rhodovulum sulfidophilum]MBL3611155.1 phage head closure protein [Rhodovulum sulfidophilum]MCE8457821.1 phage head closure protein [Rhodovulum sulfidophilum]